MFSTITIASSTTKPVEIVSAISDRLSSENCIQPSSYSFITPNVPISDSGTATPGITVARSAAEEQVDHRDDEQDRQHAA